MAARLAEEIKRQKGLETELKVGRDGSFEVKQGERLLFSKLSTKRFPAAKEVIEKLK